VTEAYDRGVEAYAMNFPLTANPYKGWRLAPKSMDWLSGWNDAASGRTKTFVDDCGDLVSVEPEEEGDDE
jgi:hypothetical protein